METLMSYSRIYPCSSCALKAAQRSSLPQVANYGAVEPDGVLAAYKKQNKKQNTNLDLISESIELKGSKTDLLSSITCQTENGITSIGVRVVRSEAGVEGALFDSHGSPEQRVNFPLNSSGSVRQQMHTMASVMVSVFVSLL